MQASSSAQFFRGARNFGPNLDLENRLMELYVDSRKLGEVVRMSVTAVTAGSVDACLFLVG
jgi:hypothetical protein